MAKTIQTKNPTISELISVLEIVQEQAGKDAIVEVPDYENRIEFISIRAITVFSKGLDRGKGVQIF